MNPFVYHTAAQRYARSRPYFHPLVINIIKETLQLKAPLAQVLDVACGTGQSTRALKDIASHIIATDMSSGMLSQVASDPSIMFVQTPSEMLPFADNSFDLMTVALAFHWFDRERFLREAARVLRPQGWLIIYNNWFSGQMIENPQYEDWNKQIYLTRFPTPKRNNSLLSAADVEPYRLTLAHQQTYTNELVFALPDFARYLMTQSNVIAQLEAGQETPEGIFDWLIESMTPLFQGSQATFLFRGVIEYVQKG